MSMEQVGRWSKMANGWEDGMGWRWGRAPISYLVTGLQRAGSSLPLQLVYIWRLQCPGAAGRWEGRGGVSGKVACTSGSVVLFRDSGSGTTGLSDQTGGFLFLWRYKLDACAGS